MFNLFSNDPDANEKTPVMFLNSLSGKKEVFTPLSRKQVLMYSCGPTVYDHIHIGNLRTYLLSDLIKRVLMYNGYKVKHTINFTDFGHLSSDGDDGEDKIMKGMQREGYPITMEGMRDFVIPYIESFKRDNERFGNLPASTYARASDYVREQIKIIETLMEKGYGYELDDGLYFDISKFPTYGQLQNIDLDAIKAGARVAVNENKRHPADFALWKKVDPENDAGLGWESRYGRGFPGWHIECTAMVFATLAKQIDIHTGGEDLAYTHHNAEIAQAEAVTNKTFVNYWLHNAFINIDNEKIAKSVGNVITLTELVDKGYHPEDYRYWMLQSHYRTTANFTFEALDAAKQALTRLKRHVYEDLGDQPITQPDTTYEAKFTTAINDDLDTPKAIALLWDLMKDESVAPAAKLATIHTIDSVLEIGLSKPTAEGLAALGHVAADALPDEIKAMIEERDLARAGQNWPESDRLREQLQIKGYQVEDTPDGTKVSKI